MPHKLFFFSFWLSGILSISFLLMGFRLGHSPKIGLMLLLMVRSYARHQARLTKNRLFLWRAMKIIDFWLASRRDRKIDAKDNTDTDTDS